MFVRGSFDRRIGVFVRNTSTLLVKSIQSSSTSIIVIGKIVCFQQFQSADASNIEKWPCLGIGKGNGPWHTEEADL